MANRRVSISDNQKNAMKALVSRVRRKAGSTLFNAADKSATDLLNKDRDDDDRVIESAESVSFRSGS